MDYRTGYIVAFAVLDKRETQLNSVSMELYGLVRCLYELLEFGISIEKVCTDQHTMVCKLFRKLYNDTVFELASAFQRDYIIFRFDWRGERSSPAAFVQT